MRFGRHRTVDVTIATSAGHLHCAADGHAILVGEARVPTDDVVAVAYERQVKHLASGHLETFLYRVWSAHASAGFELSFDVHAGKNLRAAQEAWDSLVLFTRQSVEPRLVDQLARSVRSGAAVTVDPLTLDTSGVSGPSLGRRLTVPWSDVAGATVGNSAVGVQGSLGPGRPVETLFELPTSSPNAVLLPALVTALQGR